MKGVSPKNIAILHSPAVIAKRKATMFERYRGKWPNRKTTRRENKKGYVLIYMPQHPNAYKDGFVLEHRAVMESKLKRILDASEDVHHRNGVKNDNRIENLEVVVRDRHFGEVRCPHCKNNFLIK